jgi:xylose isomerase
MFEPVRAAGLQPHDLAKLLKLSRITTSMWLNGHTEPHRLHIDKVQKLVDAIDAAVQAGSLPVPADVGRAERGLYIRKALDPYWQST